MDTNSNKQAVVKRSHGISLENREKAMLTGVSKVISSNDTIVLLETSCGGLTINGSGLKINKFDVEQGTLMLEGVVNKLAYTAAKEPFVKRIFK